MSLALTLLFTAGCAESEPGLDTGLDTGAQVEDPEPAAFTFSFREWSLTENTPVVGADVEVYDAADLSQPLASTVTNPGGLADLEFVWPDGAWVVHASGEGYHDIWFWYTRTWSEQDGDAWGPMPIPTEAAWAELHALGGVEPTPGQGMLAMAVLDPTTGGAMADLTAQVSTDGTVVYCDDDEVPDPSLEAGTSIAMVYDVAPGEATLTVGNDNAEISRDFVVFADSWSFSIDMATAH